MLPEGAKRPSDDEFARFAELLRYLRLDLAQPADYAQLKAWLAARPGGAAEVVVMYRATSPDLFPTVCAQLGAAGLNGANVRVVLEKPLGHDLASAREINRVVRSVFSEEQAFRIDHYLGKAAVQNLMALRFGNALFEPLWRRESIASLQITLAESIGVGTRGDFYGRSGALRDMIQNHALQLLTMIAMEPPSRNDADAIRDEKLKVLRSLKPFSAESVVRDVVRGQYRAGTVEGRPVAGFLEEDEVSATNRNAWSEEQVAAGSRYFGSRPRIGFLSGPLGGISTILSSVAFSLKLPGCLSLAFASDSFRASRWFDADGDILLGDCFISAPCGGAAPVAAPLRSGGQAGPPRRDAEAASWCGKSLARTGTTCSLVAAGAASRRGTH